ncbi:MAG: hypothetical protein ACRD1N_01415, partial [Terriglobia bacterium]
MNSTAIDNAITACAGTGQVVMIPAGAWYVAGITFGGASDVTLRGAGPSQTKLIFTALAVCSGKGAICIEGSSGWEGNYPGSTAWTGGYAKGAASITVASAAGLSTTPGASGNIIHLDQRGDAVGITSNGASESANTVTITTSIPHGFVVGKTIGIGCVGSSEQYC